MYYSGKPVLESFWVDNQENYVYYIARSYPTLNLGNFILNILYKLVQLNASDGSKVKSIQASGVYISNNLGDIAISDDDSALYVSAYDTSSSNGNLCIHYVE